MSENAPEFENETTDNENVKSEEQVEKTPEQLAAEKAERWNALDPMYKPIIEAVNAETEEHNKKVLEIRQLDKDPNVLLAEIREQSDDPRLVAMRKKIEGWKTQIEDLIQAANKIAAESLPTDKTPEYLEAAKEAAKEKVQSIRTQIKGFEALEAMKGISLIEHFLQPETVGQAGRKPGTKTSSGSISGSWKPRFSDITIDGDSVQKELKNASGNTVKKATLGFLTDELNKRTGGNYTVLQVQNLLLESLKEAGMNKDSMPESFSWEIPHEYTTEKDNKETKIFRIVTMK